MRQESPRDILVWDDASHIPAAPIKATAAQSDVCLFPAPFKSTVWRNTCTQVLVHSYLQEKDFQGVQKQQVLI